jgi:hypothetical protein
MPSKKPKKPMLNFAAPVKTITTQVEIQEPVSVQLDRYCEFIEKTNGVRPSRDEVINRVLERLFSRDSAFKEFAGGNKGRTRSTSRASEGD